MRCVLLDGAAVVAALVQSRRAKAVGRRSMQLTGPMTTGARTRRGSERESKSQLVVQELKVVSGQHTTHPACQPLRFNLGRA